MKQVIFLQYNHCDTLFLDQQIYEYGTSKEFVTFTKASNKALKDFEREAKMWFKESLSRKINIQLRVIDSEGFMIKNILIKSNGNF